MTVWDVLGLSPTINQREIKRAYAERLKHNRPDSAPEAYQVLREAYDSAIAYAKASSAQGGRGGQEIESPVRSVDAQTEWAGDESSDSITSVDHGNSEKPERAPGIPVHPVRDGHDREAGNDSRPLGFDAIHKLVQELVAIEDRNDAVRKFESIVDADELLNIASRRAFEIQLFHCFLNSPPECYCLRLVERAAEEFSWDSRTQVDPVLKDKIDYFFARLDVARRYNRLKEVAGPGFPMPKVASILTGPYKPRAFRWLLLQNSLVRHIKTYLKDLEERNPLAFEYEFNTKTVQWWRTKIESHPFTFSHMAFGSVAGIILSMPAILSKTVEELALRMERVLGLWAGLFLKATVIVAFMILMSAMTYGAGLSLHKLWKRVSPFYKRFVWWSKSFAHTHILAGIAASILFALTLKTTEGWDVILSIGGIIFLVVTKHGVFFWCFFSYFAATVAVGVSAALIRFQLESFPGAQVAALGMVWGQVLFFQWAHRIRRWALVKGNGTMMFVVYLTMSFVMTTLLMLVIAGANAGISRWL